MMKWNDYIYQIQKKSSNWLWRLKAHSAHSSWFWSVVFIWTKIPVSVPKSVSQQEIDIMCSTATQARFNCMTMYFLSNWSTDVQQWFTVISSDIWKSWNRQLKRFRVQQFAELNSISRFHSFHSILIFGLVEELCVMLGKSLVDHIGLTLSPPETHSRRNGCFFCLEVALWISRPHFPIYEVVNFSCQNWRVVSCACAWFCDDGLQCCASRPKAYVGCFLIFHISYMSGKLYM